MMGPPIRAGLSGAPAGNGVIEVTGSASGSANTVHAAVAGTDADNWDHVWLRAYNSDAQAHDLVVMVGAQELVITIPPKVIAPILDGHPLQGGLILKAYEGDASGALSLSGWVAGARVAA